MKRSRGEEEGQVSRAAYESNVDISSSSSSSAFFARADATTLASRRMVSTSAAHRGESKKLEFVKHIKELNTSFRVWFQEQVQLDAAANLSSGVQDYIDYATQLEGRYLRRYGEVLTFGSGDCAQLGHGTEEDEDLMVKFPRVVLPLRGVKVCGISCGGLHNAVWTEQGLCYTWGCSDDGSLGRVGDETTPLLVQALADAHEFVIGVACGDGQTVAVGTSGRVWGWGCYKDKEGKKFFNPSTDAASQVGDIKKQQNDPLLIQGLANVVEVACGSAFNLALCADGAVYSWGLGECGELGRPTQPLKKPAKGDEEAKYDLEHILRHHVTPGRMLLAGTAQAPVGGVKAIGCGAYHSLLVCVGGSVLACGLNNYAQLGLGPSNTVQQALLTSVAALDGLGVVGVKGGVHHSLVLTAAGAVYAFGRSDSGQLGVATAGNDEAGSFSGVPVRVSFGGDVVVASIACGGNHNLAVTAAPGACEVFTWGYGDMLALGHGQEKDEATPRKINFAKAKIGHIAVTQVAGGGQHSAIIGQVTTL